MGELYNPYPKLPKNIRQIGERDQIVKLYVEDYVNTYLRRLYPTGGQDLRIGLLLGSTEEYDGVSYVFIDGAMEMDGVTEDGEKVDFHEHAWKKAYENLEQMFPKRTVQGWFLCGAPGCQLSPLNYWRQHSQYFPGKNKLMYLNSGLEGEEALYIASEDGFYKLRGYNIYYERNQMMQDYMISRRDIRRVDADVDNKIVRDFRIKLGERKDKIQTEKNLVGALGTLCSILAVTVMAGGIVMFNNYSKMREMESVIASVYPKGINQWQDYSIESDEPQIIVKQGEDVVKETLAPMTEEGQTQTEEGQETSVQETVPAGEAKAETTEIPTIDQAEEQAAAIGESIAKQSLYEVEDGETLYDICLKKYHSLSKLEEICELNGLEDENKIIAGQKLILP